MALYHRATISPTKEELIAAWAPTQSWGPPADVPSEVIGSYRFDDPEGRVGMEIHLVDAAGLVFQVPLTYRDEPLAGAEAALITEMEHSALGTRWVYDGLRDPRLVLMLAAVAMTGQGEALGMVVYDDRWYVAPSKVRIGRRMDPRARARSTASSSSPTRPPASVLRNDRFDLTVFRRPAAGPRPAIGLTASWDGRPDSVVLAEVQESVRARFADPTGPRSGRAAEVAPTLRGLVVGREERLEAQLLGGDVDRRPDRRDDREPAQAWRRRSGTGRR